MNIGGGEAADQLVRMMLTGTEVAVRLSGSALKNVLALSLALAKNHKRISGKVNLGKMLRETRDLRQFPMTPEQYHQFQKLAKRQMLLYSSIHDRDGRGKIIDVILPVTELDRANQILSGCCIRNHPSTRSGKGRRRRRRPLPRARSSQDGRSGRRAPRAVRRALWPSSRRRGQKKIFGRNETRTIQEPAPLHPERAGVPG